MKTNLLICFLLVSILSFGKGEREIIKDIDKINASAAKALQNNDIVKAFKEFLDAKTLADSIEDNYGSALANFHLGDIYNLMENYKSAENHYFATLKSLKGIDDEFLIASANLNLAHIYTKQGVYDKAEAYYQTALMHGAKFYKLHNYDRLKLQQVYVEARLNLSELYVNKHNLDAALMNMLKVDVSNKKISPYLHGYHSYVYGLYYAKKELFINANAKFREAIVVLENKNDDLDLQLLCKVYQQLSISLAKSDKSTEAYLALMEHNNYKEQLSDEKKLHKELITKSKFLIEDYKNNAEKANEEWLHQLDVANKFKKINIAIFITLLLLTVSVIIIYLGYVKTIKLSKTLEVKNTELEKAKNEAEKIAELKTKFISNVSHELRTPLYGVVGITSLLLENNSLNEADRKYLNSLKFSGDYLLNLINDILQVGKMEANKLELKNVTVNLKDLLNNIAHSFNYRLEETNNQLQLSIDNYVPEHIKCDKVSLSQILMNLVGNSVKFTTNGVIKLNVKLLSLKDNRVGLRFEVEDNGIGIPEEKFNTIFDNFSQIEESNLNYQGTGLGLPITKNLIELFGSEIKLESTVGEGTKISFEIDFEVDVKAKSKSNYNASSNKVAKVNKKYKILVAEDNKINQVVTKNLLNKQDYVSTIVENGEQALKEVRNNHYDLVLMDINMPIMNGNETTQAIRRFNTKLPIIALTAADIDEVKKNCKDIGYTDFIIKPFDNHEFYQTISENIQNFSVVADESNGNLRVIKAS